MKRSHAGWLASGAVGATLLLGSAGAGPPGVSARGQVEDPRAVIAASQAIGPGGIDELRSVEVGGVEQWIHVRGNDPANPILLFIHGGPGSPMMPLSWTFQRPWEDFFTVVQWDQRGAGKTFSSAGQEPDGRMTIDQMQADAEELITFLRRTYGKDKIFLMGHSWGSILGLRVAQHRPEWLLAYIGVGQVVNARRNESVGHQETLEQAVAVGDATAIRALKAMAPYPGPDGRVTLQEVIAERRWVTALGGMLYGKTNAEESALRALSPDYDDYDLESAALGEASSVQILLPQLAGVDFDEITAFDCPVLFFAGAEDRTTPTSIVEEYFDRIRAPEKRLFVVERAAHYVVNEAPGEVLVDLVRYVLPLTTATPLLNDHGHRG